MSVEYWRTIRVKFVALWKYYILQSTLAALCVLIIVLILGSEQMVLVSAIGATSFIVFAMPKSVAAQTRNVIGGHLVGLISGSVLFWNPLHPVYEYPIVVGLAFFLMVALDVEHPPAAGTALAVAIHGVSLDAFATTIVSAIIVTQCRFYLRRYLKDLV